MEDFKKDFVPYDKALKMKELGFDEPCFGFYDNGYCRECLPKSE